LLFWLITQYKIFLFFHQYIEISESNKFLNKSFNNFPYSSNFEALAIFLINNEKIIHNFAICIQRKKLFIFNNNEKEFYDIFNESSSMYEEIDQAINSDDNYFE
jgi:hypothetical protein